MKLRVAPWIVAVLGFIGAESALAGSYAFFQSYNSAEVYIVNYWRYATEAEACRGAVSFNYKPEDKRIASATYDLDTGICRITQVDEKEFPLQFFGGTGVCPGDEVFSYRSQTCGVAEPDSLDEYSAVTSAFVLGTFVFSALGFGLLSGLRAGV